MDTSPEYILQCEKAEEIQALYRYSGAFDGMNRLKQGVVFSGNDVLFQEGQLLGKRRVVWLLRQDQLQAMVLSNHSPDELRKVLGYFNDFVRGAPLCFTSMEQLWLAFCMSEKWNKVWDADKEEWVKIPVEVKR